ncbi:hypothetical protein [Halomarina litorea]|uniref:hypothetical protein n=1 Tax=Halomarina litorea TaxID=2961595 RepID=UPI0020C1D449|nr:hypothetical protein [Halomarina sp. BCD28]
MHTNTAHHPEATGPASRRARVTGPHAGYDRHGRLDHYYWRCERCGLEATDHTLESGCWRCEDDA